MKSKLLLLVLILSTSTAMAQKSSDSRSSTVPDYARFEIVQSPLLAKLTLKVDRVTGKTWEFVESKNGYAWQPLHRIKHPTISDATNSGKVNYQVFLSGIRAQITILMNINTGASWFISVDPDEGEFWNPMY